MIRRRVVVTVSPVLGRRKPSLRGRMSTGGLSGYAGGAPGRARHSGRPHRRKELVVQSLVVSFAMIVLDELTHGPAKMTLAQRDQLIQTLGFDRQHERSAYAFRSGLLAGSLTHSTPAARRMLRNSPVKSGSRS